MPVVKIDEVHRRAMRLPVTNDRGRFDMTVWGMMIARGAASTTVSAFSSSVHT